MTQKAGFAIADLNVEEAAKKCEAPAFFLHASGDDFIVPDNSVTNHAAYKGTNKTIELCDGDHNTPRPEGANVKINLFLKENLSK